MLAAIVLSTMPMTLGELLEQRLMGRAERFERRQLEHRLHLAFEQHRQHDDAPRRRAAEPGVHLRVIGRHIRQQDLLALDRALADQPFAQFDRRPNRPRRLVGIAGQQHQLCFLLGRIEQVEHRLLSVHHRREFRENQPTDREQILLTLQACG